MNKTITLTSVASLDTSDLPSKTINALIDMWLHSKRDGAIFQMYHYKDKKLYTGLNPEKVKKMSELTGYEIIDKRSEGQPLTLPFTLSEKFQFRSHQEIPTKQFLNYILAHQYGVLEAPCSCGKTVMLSYVSGHLQSKVLIIVDQGVLQAQWEDAFRLVWNKPVQHINTKSTTFEDVCTVTFQLLNKNQKLLQRISEEFGCILLDEFHSTVTPIRRDIMFMLSSKYRIGCTATPYKKGFANEVLLDTVGLVGVRVDDTNALESEVYFVNTGVAFPSNDPDDYSSSCLSLAITEKRTLLFAKIIAKATKQGRLVLGVGITVDMLWQAEELLAKCPWCKVKVYVGTTSMAQDKELRDQIANREINVVLTVKKAEKGLDLPNLDCLVIGKPANNKAFVVQLRGRVVRYVENKPIPQIYYLVDSGVLPERFAKNQSLWYRNLGDTINYI